MSLKAWIQDKFGKKIVQLPAPPTIFVEKLHPDGRELPHQDFKGQIKLGVIIGHDKTAPGAKMGPPYNLYERYYNEIVANEMKSYAAKSQPLVLVEVIYRDGVGIVGAYDKARAELCDAVVELHFNAGIGRAKGSATLCSFDTGDVDFAHVIHKAMVDLFKRLGPTDMGVQTLSKSARGGINVHSFPGGVNCLVEPFFGDNPEDAKLGMDMKQLYARSLVDAVFLWAKKTDLIKG